MQQKNIDDGVNIAVLRAFLDRKGHGGGECTKRVLNRLQLTRFGHSAVQRSLDVEEMRTHYCVSLNCPGYIYKASDIPHPLDTCNDRAVDPSFVILRERARMRKG